MQISGRVIVGGKGIPDHPVDVFSQRKGRNGAEPTLLSRAVTAADGTFRQDFSIPGTLSLDVRDLAREPRGRLLQPGRQQVTRRPRR